MNDETIASRLKGLQTTKELITLLNEIKTEETQSRKRPILTYIWQAHTQPLTNSQSYKAFRIPKKSGGWRKIAAPNKRLMHTLSYLNKMLSAAYVPTDAAMGFVRGRSVVTNASLHTKQNYVFNIDLKDFFPTIKYPTLVELFKGEPFLFSDDLAHQTAGICCIAERGETDVAQAFLPQGSPCSPILTNFVCQTLDRQLSDLGMANNLIYSRYADDITFSGNENVFQEGSDFRTALEAAIRENGFRLNTKKTRLQKPCIRQSVTGITVNEKANVARAYVREIRSLLYIWERYTYVIAQQRFDKENRWKHRHRGDLCKVLKGKLLYMKMVKGVDDPTYQQLQARFDKMNAPLQAARQVHRAELAQLARNKGCMLGWLFSFFV